MTPRVLLGSASVALRASLRALLGALVVAELPTVAELDHAPEADTLVLDAAFLHDLRALPSLHPATLVVLSTDEDALEDLRRLAPFGWALLPADVSGQELLTAITAAASGFAVLPPDLAERTLAPEPALSGTLDLSEIEPLTAREREVLALLAAGLPNKRVATRLGVSENTVKFHLSALYGKLGVSSRTAAVSEGVRRGLISV